MGKKDGSKKKEPRFQNGGPSNVQERKAIADPRFARLHTDPRFQRVPRNQTKVSIDSRFAGMFTDKAFNDPSDNNKRGRKSKTRNVVDPLRRYYKVDEEDEVDGSLDADADAALETASARAASEKRSRKKLDGKEIVGIADVLALEDERQGGTEKLDQSIGRGGQKSSGQKRSRKNHKSGGVDSDDSEGVAEGVEDRGAQSLIASALEEGGEDEESEDEGSGLEGGDDEEDASSSSSSSSDSEDDVDGALSEEVEEKIPTTNDETRRLAIMNMDWEHIRAVHLLVVMRSFVPKGGRVNSVTIYPSEFGIEQMKEESVHGPTSVFKNSNVDDDEGEEGADPEKLREYEIAKLRYYYAVVECDSTATAGHLYRNCDGIEFERTSNTLDLRYIPDEMEFKRAPRDVASDIRGDYKPVEFETRALQHSNVKLTWDDDEPVRVKALRRNFKPDELNEMDFRAYLASSSESESDGGVDVDRPDVDESLEPNVDDDREKVRSKYLSLLAGTEDPDEVRGKKTEKGNIEIKFHTGLDDLSERLLLKAKKDKVDETVWESYLRRKKERKNARKKRKAADVSSEDDEVPSDDGDGHRSGDMFFSHGNEDPFDDPFFKQEDEDDGVTVGTKGKEKKTTQNKLKAKKSAIGEEKKRKKEEAAIEKEKAARNQAELELLLLDDHMVQNGQEATIVPSGEQVKKQKLKKKGGKGRSDVLERKLASSANYDDPRFSSLFTSHHFALDPTDPQFRKAGPVIAELQRKRLESFKKTKENSDNRSLQDGDQSSNRKSKADLSSLVRSLKSKVQTKQVQGLGEDRQSVEISSGKRRKGV